ncbi:hypothetical protein [Comamonas kerstersii]|uniref:hypothetical protein n=1 Tax=Comamonas kerstersii TaxID=225992 RepID=UPI001B327742|nr:hypothetical protein [Comamonas kerstersii]QTW17802.1 hypothetical protein H8N02_11165 [Comamonas kerstersii]
MTQAEAKEHIVSLWKEWLLTREPSDKYNDMLIFYAQLRRNHPELLNFRAAGDKWQTVKIWIQDKY